MDRVSTVEDEGGFDRIIAKKVRGIANFKPNSSGINEPNIIPLIVDNCQQSQSVTPVPRI